MSQKVTHAEMTAAAVVHQEAHAPTIVNRTFELPKALYGVTVGAYLGFLAVMALAFGNPHLSILMAIFVFSIVAGFGVPTIWATMKPDTSFRALAWGRFASKGVQTMSGQVTARDASVQVLILPVLILMWGLAVVVIAAVVR